MPRKNTSQYIGFDAHASLMGRAFTPWYLIVELQSRFRVSPCGICVGQSGISTGVFFPQHFIFSLSVYFLQCPELILTLQFSCQYSFANAPYSYSPWIVLLSYERRAKTGKLQTKQLAVGYRGKLGTRVLLHCCQSSKVKRSLLSRLVSAQRVCSLHNAGDEHNGLRRFKNSFMETT